MPLYLIRHRGILAIDQDPIATHAAHDPVEPLHESLVEAPLHQAERIAGMPNGVSIFPAPAGDFADDAGGHVVVAEGGEWRREGPTSGHTAGGLGTT